MKKHTYLVLFDNLSPIKIDATSRESARILAQAEKINAGEDEKYIQEVTYIIDSSLDVCWSLISFGAMRVSGESEMQAEAAFSHGCGFCCITDEQIEKLEQRVEDLEEMLDKLRAWAEFYPLDIFPEPDMKEVANALRVVGITLDSVSASAMRHVLTQVTEMINEVYPPQQAQTEAARPHNPAINE